MNKKIYILLFYSLTTVFNVCGQIGLGTNSPDASAELDIYSTSKGLLAPRISLSSDLSNPLPVTAPANGLLVFNIGVNQPQGFYYWTGSVWKLLKSPSASDIVSNNTSTDNAAVRFDGTSGKIIQNSTALISDNANISGLNQITTNGFRLTTNPAAGLQLVSDATGNGSWQGAPPIDVKYNNALVVANANILNFNSGINVQSLAGNKAKVTFYNVNVTQNLMQLSTPDSTDVNTATPTVINWITEHYKDAATFTHSNISYPSRIYVNSNGIYEVNFMFSAINKTIKRQTLRAQLRKNGTSIFPHVTSYSFTYQYADNRISHISSSFLIQLAANDYIELLTNRETNDGEMRLVPNENVFFIRLMRKL
ncbi:MAG: hypothetical protein HOO86_17005 [Bacteroidales bacterium]|nr:hypothetical protein [Bacteroidales bacterium]